MKKMSQLKKLALHLGRGKSITPMEAKQVYGIERLAARIHELDRSYYIVHELKRDEAGRRYTSYRANESTTTRRRLLDYARA